MTKRLLALSLLVIALLWAYSRNRLTYEQYEALRKNEEKERDAEYYRKHPSRLSQKEERDREYEEWMQSEEGRRIQAMTNQYLEMEEIEDVIEEKFTHAE